MGIRTLDLDMMCAMTNDTSETTDNRGEVVLAFISLLV